MEAARQAKGHRRTPSDDASAVIDIRPLVRHLAPSQELRQRVNWAQIQAMAIDLHEVGDGFSVDLPADCYEAVSYTHLTLPTTPYV